MSPRFRLGFCGAPLGSQWSSVGLRQQTLLPARPDRVHRVSRRRERAALGTRALAEDGTVICPGKFDTFHRGHRALASAAAALGSPTLLSFSGMAETLGWPPRAPVVAPVERPAILRKWATAVGRPVSYRSLPFGDVRELTPREFVNMLVEELGAVAIVCGHDWRFGHRAAGDVAHLLELAKEIPSLRVQVVDAVRIPAGKPAQALTPGGRKSGDDADESGIIVSSSEVRRALAVGDVALAAKLMDRPHRLVGWLDEITEDRVICEDFVNQIPGDGRYQALIRVPGQSDPVRSYVQVRRPSASDPMLPVAPGSVQVSIFDASSVFCDGCEVYIDFEDRVS